MVANYSNILGLRDQGNGAKPRVEQMLASYLSPESAPSLKTPTLPNKLFRTTSNLVGKAYPMACQVGACLHTMAVLQTYQNDLLKDLDEGEEMGSEDIKELCRAADLSLWATKEMARAIGHSMTMERHLWLNLSDIKEKDRFFLLNTPLVPSGLFGDAVNSVIERIQEAKKQKCKASESEASEGRPLLGKAVYTSSCSACFSSVPSGDWSCNPATFGDSGHSRLQSLELSPVSSVLSVHPET